MISFLDGFIFGSLIYLSVVYVFIFKFMLRRIDNIAAPGSFSERLIQRPGNSGAIVVIIVEIILIPSICLTICVLSAGFIYYWINLAGRHETITVQVCNVITRQGRITRCMTDINLFGSMVAIAVCIWLHYLIYARKISHKSLESE